MVKKTYVVFIGRKLGIYNSWPEAQSQVHGYSGARHFSYKTREEAKRPFFLEFWGLNNEDGSAITNGHGRVADDVHNINEKLKISDRGHTSCTEAVHVYD